MSQAEGAERWQEIVLFVVLLLVCGLTLSENKPDPDFWGHVQYGRDMLAEGLPRTTTYAYTVDDHAWVNHEVLSELLMALCVGSMGPVGLLGIKCLIGVAIIGAILRRAARRGAAPLTLALIALLVAVNLMYFWLPRPQLMSFLLFTVLLCLLETVLGRKSEIGDRRSEEGKRRPEGETLGAVRRAAASVCGFFRPGVSKTRNPVPDSKFPISDLRSPISVLRTPISGLLPWLWLAPVVLALWANAHGGFVLGYGVLAIYLMACGFEAYRKHGNRALPRIGLLVVVLIVSGLATGLNPYGFGLHAWIWESLSSPRPEIIEWRPPELLNIVWVPWWLLVGLSVLALTTGRRRLGLAQTAILLVLLWQSLEHRRNIPFFAIAFGILLPDRVDSLLARLRRLGARDAKAADTRGGQPRWLTVATAVAAIAIACLLAGNLCVMPVMRGTYPVTAFEYMARHDLHGKLVTRFMWAQYALATFGDEDPEPAATQLAFDGRFRTCYPQEIVDMYFDFALGEYDPDPRHRSSNSPPIDGSRILEYRRPDLVLLDRNQPHPIELLAARRREWVLLYQDELAQLWGRASRYGDPDSSDWVAPSERNVSDAPQTGFVLGPPCRAAGALALEARDTRACHCFQRKDNDMDTSYVDGFSAADTSVPLVARADSPTDAPAVERAEESLAQLDRLANLLSAENRATPPVVDYQVPAGFRLSVVIPVYNEETTVLQVLARVWAIPLETEIIVVDDASTDCTRSCLEGLRGSSGLQLLFKPQNEGKGAALRTGFAAATGDVVVIQDADLEYDPRDIPVVIRPIVEGQADVVYGSRFLGEEPQDPSLLHRLINRVLTESSNCFTGLRLTDMETCYKAFRRDVVRDLPLRQNRFGFEPEVTAKLARRGHSVVERPIHYCARGYAEGKKIGVRDAFNALYCIVRYGFKD